MCSRDAEDSLADAVGPRQRYVAAYRLGGTSGGAGLCAGTFPRCPADGEHIMAAVRAVSR